MSKPIKIATVRASSYLNKGLQQHREVLKSGGVIIIPINDVYYEHLSRKERFQLFYGGSGSGKSHFVATLLLLRALNRQHFRCLYVRKHERSVRTSQFALFKDLISEYGLNDFFETSESDMKIRCTATGNTLLPAGLDDVHKVRSVPGLNCVWLEELIDRKGAVSKSDFLELNRRLRSSGDNIIYMTFNPIVRQSWVFDMFFSKRNEDAFILKTTYQDNLFLPDDFKAQMEALKGISPEEYEVFTRGEWGSIDNADLFLFDESAVYSLHTNSDFVAGGDACITADLAFTGEDKTVIMVWRGWKVVDVKVLPKSSASDIVSSIRHLCAVHKVPQAKVCFDATGVGVAMRSLLPAAFAYDASSSPINDLPSIAGASRVSSKPAFKNLRAQVYEYAARMVNNHLAAYAPSFGLETLQSELLQVRWSTANDTVKHQIESKDLMRSRLGRSPDFADAFVMRSVFDLLSSGRTKNSRNFFSSHISYA